MIPAIGLCAFLLQAQPPESEIEAPGQITGGALSTDRRTLYLRAYGEASLHRYRIEDRAWDDPLPMPACPSDVGTRDGWILVTFEDMDTFLAVSEADPSHSLERSLNGWISLSVVRGGGQAPVVALAGREPPPRRQWAVAILSVPEFEVLSAEGFELAGNASPPLWCSPHAEWFYDAGTQGVRVFSRARRGQVVASVRRRDEDAGDKLAVAPQGHAAVFGARGWDPGLDSSYPMVRARDVRFLEGSRDAVGAIAGSAPGTTGRRLQGFELYDAFTWERRDGIEVDPCALVDWWWTGEKAIAVARTVQGGRTVDRVVEYALPASRPVEAGLLPSPPRIGAPVGAAYRWELPAGAELVEGPEGAELSSPELRWTPTGRDFTEGTGLRGLRIRLAAGHGSIELRAVLEAKVGWIDFHAPDDFGLLETGLGDLGGTDVAVDIERERILVLHPDCALLDAFDPSGRRVGRVDVPRGSSRVAVAAGAWYVCAPETGELWVVDPDRIRVERRVSTGGDRPSCVATVGGQVLVATDRGLRALERGTRLGPDLLERLEDARQRPSLVAERMAYVADGRLLVLQGLSSAFVYRYAGGRLDFVRRLDPRSSLAEVDPEASALLAENRLVDLESGEERTFQEERVQSAHPWPEADPPQVFTIRVDSSGGVRYSLVERGTGRIVREGRLPLDTPGRLWVGEHTAFIASKTRALILPRGELADP